MIYCYLHEDLLNIHLLMGCDTLFFLLTERRMRLYDAVDGRVLGERSASTSGHGTSAYLPRAHFRHIEQCRNYGQLHEGKTIALGRRTKSMYVNMLNGSDELGL